MTKEGGKAVAKRFVAFFIGFILMDSLHVVFNLDKMSKGEGAWECQIF